MKRLEKILVNIVGTMVAVYAAIVLLFSLPFLQRALAGWTAEMLSEQLKSKVEIESVNLGFLNRLIVNDMVIYEPNGKRMARIARVSASVNLFSLLSGKVNIGTAQLFGTQATLYKETPESAPNYQFIVDAFTEEDKEEPSKLDLHIGSFIMRHTDVTFDVKSEPVRKEALDINHLNLKDVGMNVVLRCLTNDSLDVTIKRLQAKEMNSGIVLRDTRFKLVANNNQGTLSDFKLSLPHSTFYVDSLYTEYGRLEKDSVFRIQSTLIHGSLTPRDLALFNPKLAESTTPIRFSFHVDGDEKQVMVKNFDLCSEGDGLTMLAEVGVDHPLKKARRNIHAGISTFHVNSTEMQMLADVFVPNHGQEALIQAIEDIAYSGTVDYTANEGLTSQGLLATGVGRAEYELTYDPDGLLVATINGDSIDLGKLTADEKFGTTSMDMDIAMNLSNTKPFPTGKATMDIHNIFYNGYNYQNINLDVRSNSTHLEGDASIDDEHLKATADFVYQDASSKMIDLNLCVEEINPNILNITEDFKGEVLSFNVMANLQGYDFGHLYGSVDVEDLNMATATELYHLDSVRFMAEKSEDGENLYTIQGDFLSAEIKGETTLPDIAKSFTNQLSHHLPIFFSPSEVGQSHFTYQLTLTDSPILHHFTEVDFAIQQPIHMIGEMDASAREMTLTLRAPRISYDGKSYRDVDMKCESTADNMNIRAAVSSLEQSDDSDVPPTSTRLDVVADVHDDCISSDLKVNIKGRNNIQLQLLPMVQLQDSMGSMKTDIQLQASQAVINDTVWTVSPSRITLYKKDVECHHVKFGSMRANSYLAIDGKASSSPSDSLVATLNNLEVKYLLSLTTFTAVRFAGQASGRVVLKNVLGGGIPNVNANLFVHDLSIQEGVLGDADITAHWDTEVDGIAMNGRIVGSYQVPDGLTGREKNLTGITTVDGWVSPAKKDMAIHVDTHNTNAKFIHGFLRGVFKDVSGCVTGPVDIIGPFNNVNIIADAVPNMNLQLRATNVPYHIEGDTIHMRPYRFEFPNISLYDRFGHRSTLNGLVTHRNMKNFAYHFQADLHELLAYDETEFNSDKFLATLFADGDLTIDGSDGHPLYVNASVTPTRGSVFAYDAATPDAITGNSFIEFRDRDSIMAFNPHLFDRSMEEEQKPVVKDSLTIVKEARQNYDSDIYINFDINLTPACEVKLRMDNLAEDGYMHTFGNAKIKARWYNKGNFQMFGNYNIESGSYRLYLQDIIFRDLALQPGSMVEFNGNPFDANIHLLCHHTIPSVPLSDLTATTAFSQNNKVKVICILDITGKLGNMDFKFDLDIPNVSEEARQLVRSMINSEEEMNTQVIYLLGLGRFYPNEYARANGNGNSGQAANSLLSSTLSGQINQMLGSMIGNNPNWNFGSSLSTGEKGWHDLDVEGLLEGRLLDERLIINGAFGYRDNAMTNRSSFIGDFEVKWRMNQKGNLYVKAYNQTNDRYFTKATINTQGIGLSWRQNFESIRRRMKQKEKKNKK